VISLDDKYKDKEKRTFMHEEIVERKEWRIME
jgi:hypothetical protein